jgi:hypothetical protein
VRTEGRARGDRIHSSVANAVVEGRRQVHPTVGQTGFPTAACCTPRPSELSRSDATLPENTPQEKDQADSVRGAADRKDPVGEPFREEDVSHRPSHRTLALG